MTKSRIWGISHQESRAKKAGSGGGGEREELGDGGGNWVVPTQIKGGQGVTIKG